MRHALLLLALGGCAVAGTQSISREAESLQNELAGRVAGEPERCVHASQSDALRAVDPNTIVYRRGGVIWVNRLPASCPGLRPLTTLIIEPKLGTSYCRDDLVRALEPGATIPGPVCRIGDFVPYRKP